MIEEGFFEVFSCKSTLPFARKPANSKIYETCFRWQNRPCNLQDALWMAIGRVNAGVSSYRWSILKDLCTRFNWIFPFHLFVFFLLSQCCARCEKDFLPGELGVFSDKLPGKAWHPACFTCKECNQFLVELVHFVKDGEIYCGRHHAELTKPRCAGCDEVCLLAFWFISFVHVFFFFFFYLHFLNTVESVLATTWQKRPLENCGRTFSVPSNPGFKCTECFLENATTWEMRIADTGGRPKVLNQPDAKATTCIKLSEKLFSIDQLFLHKHSKRAIFAFASFAWRGRCQLRPAYTWELPMADVDGSHRAYVQLHIEFFLNQTWQMRPPEKLDHLLPVPSVVVIHRFDCNASVILPPLFAVLIPFVVVSPHFGVQSSVLFFFLKIGKSWLPFLGKGASFFAHVLLFVWFCPIFAAADLVRNVHQGTGQELPCKPLLLHSLRPSACSRHRERGVCESRRPSRVHGLLQQRSGQVLCRLWRADRARRGAVGTQRTELASQMLRLQQVQDKPRPQQIPDRRRKSLLPDVLQWRHWALRWVLAAYRSRATSFRCQRQEMARRMLCLCVLQSEPRWRTLLPAQLWLAVQYLLPRPAQHQVQCMQQAARSGGRTELRW